MPVQYIELRVGHGIDVLLDELEFEPVAARVNHGGTELKSEKCESENVSFEPVEDTFYYVLITHLGESAIWVPSTLVPASTSWERVSSPYIAPNTVWAVIWIRGGKIVSL